MGLSPHVLIVCFLAQRFSSKVSSPCDPDRRFLVRRTPCTFSCKGRWVMVDSSTAGAARRLTVWLRAAWPRLVGRRSRVDRPISAKTACSTAEARPQSWHRLRDGSNLRRLVRSLEMESELFRRRHRLAIASRGRPNLCARSPRCCLVELRACHHHRSCSPGPLRTPGVLGRESPQLHQIRGSGRDPWRCRSLGGKAFSAAHGCACDC
jgi:hypothetical protein